MDHWIPWGQGHLVYLVLIFRQVSCIKPDAYSFSRKNKSVNPTVSNVHNKTYKLGFRLKSRFQNIISVTWPPLHTQFHQQFNWLVPSLILPKEPLLQNHWNPLMYKGKKEFDKRVTMKYHMGCEGIFFFRYEPLHKTVVQSTTSYL